MKRNPIPPSFILFLGLTLFPPFYACTQILRVAVAANAQFVMNDIKKAFEQKGTARIELIVSSSGKLTAQISHGAPYDLFLSADMKYPEQLYNRGYTLEAPSVYAYGSLVLWTLKKKYLDNGLNSVTNPEIKTIAIGNPSTAPYGMAAVQVLKNAGIYEKVKSKIVYGESVSQVNQYLISGAADLVFTAKSVVMTPGLKQKGQWTEPPESLYDPIKQGMVILKNAAKNNLKAAREFFDFLSGPEAKAIFTSYGYIVK